MAESPFRIKIKTERLEILTPGVAQVLSPNHDLTYSVSIYSDDANTDVLYVGNDGNDTVSASTGRPLNPGDPLDFNATAFFSPHTEYISMKTIYIICNSAGSYRLLYWVNA
jgi:hypothetical protein